MAMLVMGIGVMLMAMLHGLVVMRMSVRCAWRDRVRMIVLMVSIMRVFVLVIDCRVNMLMHVPLRQVQPEADGHERSGGHQLNSQPFVQKHKGE